MRGADAFAGGCEVAEARRCGTAAQRVEGIAQVVASSHGASSTTSVASVAGDARRSTAQQPSRARYSTNLSAAAPDARRSIGTGYPPSSTSRISIVSRYSRNSAIFPSRTRIRKW